MEKLIYLAQLSPQTSADEFRDKQLASLRDAVLPTQLGVQQCAISFADQDVKAADIWKIESLAPLPQIVISLKLHTSNHHPTILRALESAGLVAIEGYLVSESEVLIDEDDGPHRPNGRSAGTLQFCTLQALKELSQSAFLEAWRGKHTAVALETQSTTAYRQNLVVAKLTRHCKDHDAIIEEQFPAAAMDDPAVFFDAVGDADKLAHNQTIMAESCSQFIDFSSINVVHLSEYRLK